ELDVASALLIRDLEHDLRVRIRGLELFDDARDEVVADREIEARRGVVRCADAGQREQYGDRDERSAHRDSPELAVGLLPQPFEMCFPQRLVAFVWQQPNVGRL